MRTFTSVLVLALIVLACSGQAQAASGSYKLCSTGPGNPIVSPGKGGKCAHGQHALALARAAQVDSLKRRVGALEATLAGVSRSGQTLRLSGLNLQLVSGSGSTSGPVNGRGNLIIGYGEHRAADHQTGSHNLVLGVNQSFTAYGGVVGGYQNTLSGRYGAVFGIYNTADGPASTVAGGPQNGATGFASAVAGGYSSTASGDFAAVAGGASNTASGNESAVAGGASNAASGLYSAVAGGSFNTASGVASLARGGQHQSVTANYGYAP
jgi:hypothetical protein